MWPQDQSVCQSVNVIPPSEIHLSYVQFPILAENNLGNYKTIRDYMFENLGYTPIISTVTNKPVRARGGGMKYPFACTESKTSALLN